MIGVTDAENLAATEITSYPAHNLLSTNLSEVKAKNTYLESHFS